MRFGVRIALGDGAQVGFEARELALESGEKLRGNHRGVRAMKAKCDAEDEGENMGYFSLPFRRAELKALLPMSTQPNKICST